MVELFLLFAIIEILQAPAPTAPLMAVLTVLLSVTLGGISSYVVNKLQKPDALKEKNFDDLVSTVKDISHRTSLIEIRFAALTGRSNGESYRKDG